MLKDGIKAGLRLGLDLKLGLGFRVRVRFNVRLIENESRNLSELPPCHKAFERKWLFEVKHRIDGTVQHFKAP